MHSTLEEAVTVGIKMGATRSAMTHFSQRYTFSDSVSKGRQKMTYDNESPEVRDYLNTSGIMALDLLRFRMSELIALPGLSPAFNFGISEEKT